MLTGKQRYLVRRRPDWLTKFSEGRVLLPRTRSAARFLRSHDDGCTRQLANASLSRAGPVIELAPQVEQAVLSRTLDGGLTGRRADRGFNDTLVACRSDYAHRVLSAILCCGGDNHGHRYRQESVSRRRPRSRWWSRVLRGWTRPPKFKAWLTCRLA